MEASMAARRGKPAALPMPYALALAQTEPADWDCVMREAVRSGNLDCVKVLYDMGYEQHRSTEPNLHAAVFAVDYGQLEILRFVVEGSGPSQSGWLNGECAVQGGVEMLQYVRELGCVFDECAPETAARQGELEALRYLHTMEPLGILVHW
jgi:hypothetical protein